jgi:hypothetical protein
VRVDYLHHFTVLDGRLSQVADCSFDVPARVDTKEANAAEWVHFGCSEIDKHGFEMLVFELYLETSFD